MQNEERVEITDGTGVIVATIIKTLACLLVILPLAFYALTLCFPLSAAELYSGVGNKQKAYSYYSVEYSRSGGADSLVRCISLSSSLFSANADFSGELEKNTRAFVTADFRDLKAAQLDAFAKANLPRSAQANEYSYLDYVYCRNVAASLAVGDERILLSDGTKKTFDDFVESANFSALTVEEVSVLSRISTFIEKKSGTEFFTSEIRSAIKELVARYKTALSSYVAPAKLDELYRYKALEKIAVRCRASGAFSDGELNEICLVTRNEITSDITELYRVMLAEYIG